MVTPTIIIYKISVAVNSIIFPNNIKNSPVYLYLSIYLNLVSLENYICSTHTPIWRKPIQFYKKTFEMTEGVEF